MTHKFGPRLATSATIFALKDVLMNILMVAKSFCRFEISVACLASVTSAIVAKKLLLALSFFSQIKSLLRFEWVYQAAFPPVMMIVTDGGCCDDNVTDSCGCDDDSDR